MSIALSNGGTLSLHPFDSKIANFSKVSYPMAIITITNISPNGTELFHDSESFLSELKDVELNLTGGIYYTWFFRKLPPARFPVFRA